MSSKMDDVKIFKILSYIGLWIIGLFVKQKNDKKLRFHVGQGIVLSIYCVVSNLVKIILTEIINSIFRKEQLILGMKTGIYTVGVVGKVLISIVSLIQILSIIYFVIVGIKNVLNDKQKNLPIIGKYSFYN